MITDLVIFLRPRHRGTNPQDILTAAESVLLASLRQLGPTRIDLLEKRCGLPKNGLHNQSLLRFKESGIIRFRQGGLVELRRQWAYDSRIIAIEAKLTRWKEALNQAVGYRQYADKVYVALPAESADNASRARRRFKERGVGLLVLSDRILVPTIPASPTRNHDWRREFVYSRLAAHTEPCQPLKKGTPHVS